jgi:hypothetical protein
VLELCRRAAVEQPEAAAALARWNAWRLARDRGKRERRFRRRAYTRARERAVGALLMRRRPG